MVATLVMARMPVMNAEGKIGQYIEPYGNMQRAGPYISLDVP